MYIVVISGGIPSKSRPLDGIFQFDQAKALKSLGHKIVYVSLDLRSVRHWRQWRLNRFERNGIIVYHYPIPLGKLPARLILYFGRRGLLKLYQIIEKEQGIPDIVHAHFTQIAAVASILKQKYALPYVITEHSSKINQEKIDHKTRIFASQAYPYADQLISVSSLLANRIHTQLGFTSKVIHNIVDSNFINSDFLPLLNKPFRFVSVGNLIHRKGFDLLIEAFAKAKLPEYVQLDIIGSGEYQTKLQTLIQYYHLESRIHLLGFQNRKEIATQMQQASAFVLASRHETFGVVYIEALMSGLPVIATRCGGPEDFVNENNGLLIPTEDVDALTKALEAMYLTANDYDRKAISESCQQMFAPQVIAKQLIDTYSTILDHA